MEQARKAGDPEPEEDRDEVRVVAGGGGGRSQDSGKRGRGGGFAAGSGGFCVCPNCGERAPHELGSPCYEHKCPKCGTTMTRE